MAKLLELLGKIPSKYYLPLGIGCIGLILFGYGIFNMLQPSQAREKFSFQSASQIPLNQKTAVLGSNTTMIAIDVEGAVASPSVYQISSTSRLKDALIAAGGFSSLADRAWVALHINLAAKLTDGAKIYIPSVGEVAKIPSAGQVGQGAEVTGMSTTNQQININSATSQDLDSLPGVGQVTAQKIINGRPYNSIDELTTRKIINKSTYNKIKDSIIVE